MNSSFYCLAKKFDFLNNKKSEFPIGRQRHLPKQLTKISGKQIYINGKKGLTTSPLRHAQILICKQQSEEDGEEIFQYIYQNTSLLDIIYKLKIYIGYYISNWDIIYQIKQRFPPLKDVTFWIFSKFPICQYYDPLLSEDNN